MANLTVTEANQVLSAINTLRRIFPDELDPTKPILVPPANKEARLVLHDLEYRAIAVRDADQAKRMAEHAEKMATPVNLGPRLGEVDRRKLYTVVVKIIESRRTSDGYKNFDTGRRQTLKHRQPLDAWAGWQGKQKAAIGTLNENGTEIGSSEWLSEGGQKRRRIDIALIESVTAETPEDEKAQ